MKKWVAPFLSAVGMACATSVAMAASGSAPLAPANPQLARRILATHNAERERLHLPALRWNGKLEREAAQWAQSLSQRGVVQHDSDGARNGTGENLWMGTAGYWMVEDIVEMFIAEKANFHSGTFPHISRTGNWADVGHYSQVVWRDTREVGCALVTGRGNDVLVCRYWPAGNVWG
ncbi:SCP-like extracellular [Erythrobacter mangrovi]|uniref:SCP-like extracellular n=2 Tax=Erythrobacter mangrovi TaxID=2739433 RepID=A0A7D4BI91_9SPHN|nr:SCP-like extracellular [Erythrobacter mangrovi]